MKINNFSKQSVSIGAASGLIATLLLPVFASSALALVGAHSYTNTSTGDVFLGGDYIELSISKYGSFGTTAGQPLPTGFYGTAARTNIGMSTNPAGFGVSPDLRMDYFLPGTPEERWSVGYTIGSTQTTGSNAFLDGSTDISNNTVTNQSSGSNLQATSVGTLNSQLQINQVISFNESDAFFLNTVTLKNIGSNTLNSVRYMRSVDPDNTVDQGGSYTTHNDILDTFAAGDGKAVVMADTSNNASDPVFLANGSHSPLIYYSSDSQARVSTFGFENSNPYASQAYDSAPAQGTAVNADQAITIDFDVGTLAPGASQTVSYYTSLDNRDFSDVLQSISNAQSNANSDGDNISDAVENAGPNNGDGNGDGILDSLQSNVTSLPNTVEGGGAYETVATSGCNNISTVDVSKSSAFGTDGSYSYPLGMTDLDIQCSNPGDTATITIYYDKKYDTTNWQARKYIHGSFITIPGARFGTAVVGSNTVTTLTYSVTDGGPLDDDGTANGVIVDPAGPAIPDNTTLAAAPNTGYGSSARINAVAQALAIFAIVSTSMGLRILYRQNAMKRSPDL